MEIRPFSLRQVLAPSAATGRRSRRVSERLLPWSARHLASGTLAALRASSSGSLSSAILLLWRWWWRKSQFVWCKLPVTVQVKLRQCRAGVVQFVGINEVVLILVQCRHEPQCRSRRDMRRRGLLVVFVVAAASAASTASGASASLTARTALTNGFSWRRRTLGCRREAGPGTSL